MFYGFEWSFLNSLLFAAIFLSAVGNGKDKDTKIPVILVNILKFKKVSSKVRTEVSVDYWVLFSPATLLSALSSGLCSLLNLIKSEPVISLRPVAHIIIRNNTFHSLTFLLGEQERNLARSLHNFTFEKGTAKERKAKFLCRGGMSFPFITIH